MKNLLALLADWANGIFALLTASWIVGTELEWWMVPIALLLSHLPDIDAVPELLSRGRVSASAEYTRDHRTFLHYPLLAAVVCVLALAYGDFWGMVVAIVIPLHLFNDLYGTGWGLPLLWPFTNRRYKLFSRRVNRLRFILENQGDWELLEADERRLRAMVSWSAEELPSYITHWGVDEWIPLWYQKRNWISVFEYTLFLVACILLILKITS